MNLYCIERELNLSRDQSLIHDLLKNIIDDFSLNKNDVLCLLQPTNPVRENDLFQRAINLYEKGTMTVL